MRRPVVPLALFAVAAAIWALGVAGPAAATPTAPGVVCPLLSPRLVPCCTPPPNSPSGAATSHAPAQSICCQTGPCCDPLRSGVCCAPTPCGSGGLTIGAAPSPSTAGRKVVISGSLFGGPAGALVVLWRELAGQSTFLQMAQTTTNAAGAYAFTLAGTAVMTDQAWYVTSNGTRSTTIQQHVHALVGLASSAHAAAVRQTILLTGRVTPSHSGEVVWIEQRLGGIWHVIAHPRLGRHSTYASARRFARTGTVELRTVLRGDARNIRSVSPTLTLAVRP